jgi:tRNA A-37 threonylcarbamoyl transferase component Bud32
LSAPDVRVVPAVRFTVTGRLGGGGGGEVHSVTDHHLEREVALKVMRDPRPGSATAVARFIDEARLTARLEHPNILPVHDLACDASGRWFFAMRKASGRTLADAIADAERGEPGDVMSTFANRVDVMSRVCEAVAYAHNRGVIHRDLKPSNILLGEFGEVIVIDWGTARDLRKENTEVAQIIGTPLYMSPEQARGEPADQRSDVYCLGATFFTLLTLKKPVQVDCSREEFWLAKIQGKLPEAPAGVPPALVEIAFKAMAPEPDARYQRVEELRDALRVWQGHQASIALCERAERGLARADEARRYADYARACDDFRSALEEWPENDQAQKGLLAGTLAHARCALSRGDIGLADELIGDDARYHEVREEVRKARAAELAAKKRFLHMRLAAALGVLTVLAAVLWLVYDYRRTLGAWQTAWTFDALSDPIAKFARFDGEERERPLARTEGSVVLPRGVLFWAKGLAASGNVRLEAEIEWPGAVDGFEIVLRAETQGEGMLPRSYSCQFGGWNGTTSLISQNRERSNPSMANTIGLEFQPRRRYRVTFTLEGDEAAISVGGVERLRVRSLLPLGDLSYSNVGIRAWTNVIIHRLEVQRQVLPAKPTPLLAGDALAAAGHYADAVRRYVEVANDFSSTSFGELALARAYLAAMLAPGTQTARKELLQRLEREYPRSHHLKRCKEVAALDRWASGDVASALESAMSLLGRYPDTRLVAALLADRPQKVSAQNAIDLLNLASRTRHLARLDLSSLPISDIGVLKGQAIPQVILRHTAVKDLSPLRGMPLRSLDIQGTPVESLEPLRGMTLEELMLQQTAVRDLSPLKGMPLRAVYLDRTRVADLSPIRNKDLSRVTCSFTAVTSLEPLRGLPIEWLEATGLGIRDLGPLSGAPLRRLHAGANKIADLSPLKGKKLDSLFLSANEITDISALAGSSGSHLLLARNRISDVSPLATARWTALSLSDNPIASLEPAARVAQKLWAENLPPQRVAPFVGSALAELHLNGTPVLDPETLANVESLQSLGLHGSLPARALESLALKLERLERDERLVKSIRVQAALARRDVAALRSYATALGEKKVLVLPFETSYQAAKALALALGAELPILKDPDLRKEFYPLIPDADDVWLGLEYADGKLTWSDGSIEERPDFDPGSSLSLPGNDGISALRFGDRVSWPIFARRDPYYNAAPALVWTN